MRKETPNIKDLAARIQACQQRIQEHIMSLDIDRKKQFLENCLKG